MPDTELHKPGPVRTNVPRPVAWQAGREPADGGAEESVDVVALWTALRERMWFVLATGALVFVVVMAATLLSYMEFSSSGRLYLGELDRPAGAPGSGDALDIAGAAGDISSEIEIVRSRLLVSRSIRDAALNVQVTAAGAQPARFWRWLVSGRDPRLLDVTAKELAVIGELGQGMREAQIYTAKFVRPRNFELRDVRGRLLGRAALGETVALPEVKLTLRSGSEGAPRVGVEYAVVVQPLDDLVDGTLAALLVTIPKSASGEPAKVLTLEFTHRSPLKAATFVRELMRNYLDERLSWKKENATAAEEFVTRQLGSLRSSLDQTERKLAEYRSSTQGVVLDNEAAAMIGQIAKYEEQRVAARLEVAALSDISQVLKSPNPPIEAFLFGEANDSVLASMATSLAEARRQLTDLQERFNAAAPDVRQQQAQMNAQLRMIRGYVSNRLGRAQESLKSLDAVIAQFETKLKSVPGAELGLAQLARESEVYSRLYSFLLERQQQTAIAKASTVSHNRVLDAPQASMRESAPKLPLRLGSLLIGLLAGAAIVLVRRFVAVTYQSEAETRRSASGVPVFASVPREIASFGGARKARRLEPAELWTNPHSAFAESFRTLRTNLYRLSGGQSGFVVLFTSPSPGDGKTTCALSLAALLAADGRSVLVVDADLRKPSHHLWTGGPKDQGLRNVLAGQSNWADVVQPVSLPFAEFSSIGAGRTGPSELLSGERMSRFLSGVRSRFDFILLDVASFPLVSDALALSREANCVFSVIRLQNSPRRFASEHLRTIASNSAFHAMIINGAEPARGYGYPTPSKSAYTSFGRAQRAWRKLDPRHRLLVTAILSVVAALLLALVTSPLLSGSPTDPATQPAPNSASEASKLASGSIDAKSKPAHTMPQLPSRAEPRASTGPAATSVTADAASRTVDHGASALQGQPARTTTSETPAVRPAPRAASVVASTAKPPLKGGTPPKAPPPAVASRARADQAGAHSPGKLHVDVTEPPALPPSAPSVPPSTPAAASEQIPLPAASSLSASPAEPLPYNPY
jgi:tyrosine-protein kinase Etk/Wzc